MANTDNQFVRYPTELCEALSVCRLSPLQFNIVHYIIRKTYGWSKDKDAISIKRMSEEMGRSRPIVSTAIKELAQKGVIGIERRGNGKPAMMWIASPDNWQKPVLKNEHVSKTEHVSKSEQGVSGKQNRYLSGNPNRNLSGKPNTQYITEPFINTSQKKGDSTSFVRVQEEDMNNTMFGGKITVKEFMALSKEEQDAMYEAEGWE